MKVFRLASFYILFLLAGCGFHLRGMVDMPAWLNNIAIINHTPSRDLVTYLKDQLEGYSICVVPDPALAQYWLILEHEETRQQIMSVSSTTTPRQYQLIYTLEYKLQNAHGAEKSAGIVSATRQLTVNNDRILGSDEEEVLLKKEMRREAIIKLLNRIGK